MNKLHKELNNDVFVPKEGQRDFLCNNKSSFRCPSLSYKFSGNSENIDRAFEVLFEETLKNRNGKNKRP